MWLTERFNGMEDFSRCSNLHFLRFPWMLWNNGNGRIPGKGNTTTTGPGEFYTGSHNERAHPTGDPRGDTISKPRGIIAKFLNYRNKYKVLTGHQSQKVRSQTFWCMGPSDLYQRRHEQSPLHEKAIKKKLWGKISPVFSGVPHTTMGQMAGKRHQWNQLNKSGSWI